MCDCSRVVKIYLKHNDTAHTRIPHLNFEKEGYLPYIGILGGDDTQISICLDCGKIQNWVPISDDEIKETDEYKEVFGEEEE